MTNTEIIAIVGCLALGYWIVAVFVPSILEKDDAEDAGAEPDLDTDDRIDPVRVVGASDNWFDVLEIAETSSREEITDAYKRRIRQYHPDLVAHMGPELRELAELKSRQINAAYATALKLRSATYHA
jgi:DnaJ like chaperone protein